MSARSWDAIFHHGLAQRARARACRRRRVSVKVGDKAIHQLNHCRLMNWPVFFTHLQLDNMQQAIASRVVREISARINFLVNVGLDYLSLGRSANTLSGG